MGVNVIIDADIEHKKPASIVDKQFYYQYILRIKQHVPYECENIGIEKT